MTTLTVLCSLLLIGAAFGAPNRSNPDVQTRDAVDDFQKWADKTQAERRNSQTDIQQRVTRAANHQQQESMLASDLSQQSSGSLVVPGDDLPTSLIIGGGSQTPASSGDTQRTVETQRTVLPANLASGTSQGTSQVTQSPTAERQVIGGDTITNLGTELGGYFTTEPPSFWDRVGTGISSTYNKAVKKAEDIAHSVRETIEG